MMQQQTYRVTLSDGRTFDVTTEGGPPSEDDVLAGLGVGPSPDVPEPGLTVERPERPTHGAARLAQATGQGLKDFFGFVGQAVTDPAGTGKAVAGGLLQSQYDTYRKAQREQMGGNPLKAAGYGVAALTPVVGPMAASMVERSAAGEGPEVLGETASDLLLGGAGALTLKGAQKAFGSTARAAKRTARLGAKAEGELMMAVPPAKTAPWTPEDLSAAKPYLNARKRAVETVTDLRDVADEAIGDIEARVGGLVEAFPTARIEIDAEGAIRKALGDNPRGEAFERAIGELSDLPLREPMDLKLADRIRLQMNAENRAVLKKNNYDQATARKVDPGFAAREALAAELRDKLYGYLETRGIQGVRELRRDEGSLIRLRNAAERQAFAGARGVAGTNEPSMVRKAAAELLEKGGTALGAAVGGPVGAVGGAQVGETLGKAVRGGRLTRDELVKRAFAVPDDRLPQFPTLPEQPTPAGLLPPAPRVAGAAPDTSYVRGVPAEPARRDVHGSLPPARVVREAGPSPDTSGRIEPTLPENIANPPKEELFGELVDVATAAPVEERAFVLRWLADDLRELSYQPAARMRGTAAVDEFTNRAYGEKATNYAPRVRGTQTQEMFHALGITGSRAEIAERLDRFVRTGKGSPKIEALADAMREAWDGSRFDFDLLSDETVAKLGIRRRDLKSPESLPNADDMPGVYNRWFGRKAEIDEQRWNFQDEGE